MLKKQAERGGTDRAEDRTVRAIPGYGDKGWRTQAPLGAAYSSDAALRWDVSENRAALNEAGAIAMIRGRLFFLEPAFSEVMIRVAQRRAAGYGEGRLLRAQQDADQFAQQVG